MLKEIFTSLPKVFNFAWRKKKNTQTKYNAADQLVWSSWSSCWFCAYETQLNIFCFG